MLLVGMDTPQTSPELLTAAAGRLLADGTDAVFGSASDGGWWALGLRRPDASLLLGVPPSTADTGRLQRDRLTAAGLRVSDLPVARDVDTMDDAVQVAALCASSSHFARALQAVCAALRVPPPRGPDRDGPPAEPLQEYS